MAPLADAVAAVHVHPVPVLPELVLAELPPGTHVLVMTHDHAEDLAICDAALRADHLGPIGLIGSSAKWARFRHQLADDGHPDEAIARIAHADRPARARPARSPPPSRSSVAAALLDAFEREAAVYATPDPPVTLFRGTFLDTPQSPFTGGHLRAETDGGAARPRRRDRRPGPVRRARRPAHPTRRSST